MESTTPNLEIVPTKTIAESANRSSEQMRADKTQKTPEDRLVSHRNRQRGRRRRRNPYQEFTRGCRKGKFDNLDYDNVTFEGVDRTSTAGGATRAFISRDERTVSLISGVVEDGIWQTKQAIACAKVPFQATIFPIPGTEWKPCASDIKVYGIEANNRPRAYMLTIILDESFKGELLPEVGCRARIFVSIAQRPHKVPQALLSTDQINEVAMKLQDHFALATSKAYNKLADAQRKLHELEECEADEEEVGEQITITEAVYDSTYMEHATNYVYGYVSIISDHITLQTPDATDNARRYIQAKLIAKELRAQPGEDEIAHFERIHIWLRQQRNIIRIRPVMNYDEDEPWNGFRVNLPAGVHEDIALFYVEVPLQADWPCYFKRPPLIVDAPDKVPIHLCTYFADITRREKKILARIEYDVDDKSLRCEANAINLMNHVEANSSAEEWWEYILAFNPDLIPRELDLWKRFPGIADGAANGRFVGQHLEAAHILKKTKQGKVIIAGGPGSGKTYFGTLIAQALVEGGVMDTSPTLFSDPTVLKAEDEAEGQAQNVNDPKAGNGIDTTEDGQKDTPDQTIDTPAAEPSIAAEGTAGNVTIEDIKNRLHRSAAAGMTWAQLAELVTREVKTLSKSLVVWTAPRNDQVVDAAIRLRNMMQDKIIVRVHTWKAEVAALLDATVRKPEVMELSDNATPTERTIVHLINTLREKEFNKRNPAASPYSISSQLRARATADPEANLLMFEILEMRDWQRRFHLLRTIGHITRCTNGPERQALDRKGWRNRRDETMACIMLNEILDCCTTIFPFSSSLMYYLCNF